MSDKAPGGSFRPQHHQALTPEALAMVDTIARTGSFAAAARELGKVPSALTYSVRQLEDSLDALLFDRSSRQAQLTDAGRELLHEGRRLLQEMQAVASRVRRVTGGWETELSVSIEDILSPMTVFELVESGRRVRKATVRANPVARMHDVWRSERSALGLGRALQWWLKRLECAATRRSLIERHVWRV